MTNEQLDALEAAAKAATPGPWRQSKHDKEFVCFNDTTLRGSDINGELNATYIAAANPATILELIAELRQARDALHFLLDCNQG